MPEPTQEQDRVPQQVVDSAYAVHTTFGPGLLETVYEQCLLVELMSRGFTVRRQVPQPLVYRGTPIEAGFRLDMVVGEAVVVEVKAVERLLPVHGSQLLTYLKLSGLRLGLLINFNVPLIKDGIRRIVSPL